MRLPHRLQGQKVKSQGGAGAYCGGDLAAQLVIGAHRDAGDQASAYILRMAYGTKIPETV